MKGVAVHAIPFFKTNFHQMVFFFKMVNNRFWGGLGETWEGYIVITSKQTNKQTLILIYINNGIT
jgi:uncharacterized protein YdbL (DUF1318 family)